MPESGILVMAGHPDPLIEKVLYVAEIVELDALWHNNLFGCKKLHVELKTHPSLAEGVQASGGI